MQRLKWWQRLSVQITGPLVGAMFAIFIALAYFIVQSQQQVALNSAFLELRSSLSIAQGALNRMYTANREVAVPEILSEIDSHGSVSHVAILDAERKIIASHPPQLSSNQLDNFLSELSTAFIRNVLETEKIHIEFHEAHQHIVAAVPLTRSLSESQSKQPKVLVVEYRHAGSWYSLEFFPWLPFSFLLLMFMFIGGALWIALQNLVAKPASHIVKGIQYFAQHGHVRSQQLPTKVQNEFGFISHRILLAARELRRRDARLRKLSAAVEQASESIMITDLQGKIEYVNPAFTRITGYTSAEVIGKNPRILASGRTPAQAYEALWQALRENKTWQGELYNVTKDGQEFREWATISPLRNEQGETTHYLASKLNITKRVEAEAKLEYLAYYDALTELPNRASSTKHLAQKLSEATAGQHGVVVLFDLDGLQRINDVRGFEFGDAILQSTASRLRSCISDEPDAFLANLEADLFAVILSPRSLAQEQVLADAQNLVKFILHELSQTLSIFGEQLSITASAGIVIYPEDAESADAIIRHAETALHTAKDAGGNQTAVYDVSYSLELERRYEIERELRQAIMGEGLELFLQPQMSTQKDLVGAEVLVRWRHQSKGLISPASFIPVAEQTDLIVDLGKWIVRRALNELKRLPTPLTLAINISPRQFRKYDFVYFIEQEIEKSGVDASRLILEMTENLLVDDAEDVIAKMLALQKRGVQFSIDDFGTGYSSLAYLQRLPLQELKIDKRFILAIGDTEQQAIAESIIAIAKTLNLRIVAEGVETQAQASFIAERDQNAILQGYLFSEPLPVEVFYKHYLN
jgi:PAS domain S-box-containing protein/diguanylate cyclase (GGDEF)-like protein